MNIVSNLFVNNILPTPTSGNLNILKPILNYVPPISYASTASSTILTTDILDGYIVRTGLLDNLQTDTFPAATTLVTGITGVHVGTYLDIFYNNATTNTITIAPGTGGSINSTTSIAPGTVHRITLFITNVTTPAYYLVVL